MPSSRETFDVLGDHVQPVERRREPVEDHRVDQLPVSQAVAEARLLERYGAFDIDSMPPVTTTSRSPARIIESAISIALIDEAQTLLIVSAGVSFGTPGADRRLARGRLTGACLQHLSHDHVLRLVRLDTDPLEGGLDRDRAQLGRLRASRARRRASRRACGRR